MVVVRCSVPRLLLLRLSSHEPVGMDRSSKAVSEEDRLKGNWASYAMGLLRLFWCYSFVTSLACSVLHGTRDLLSGFPVEDRDAG